MDDLLDNTDINQENRKIVSYYYQLKGMYQSNYSFNDALISFKNHMILTLLNRIKKVMKYNATVVKDTYQLIAITA